MTKQATTAALFDDLSNAPLQPFPGQGDRMPLILPKSAYERWLSVAAPCLTLA